jgi:hypothetical protein
MRLYECILVIFVPYFNGRIIARELIYISLSQSRLT